MKKKLFGLALVAAMTAGLASCGGQGGNTEELQAQIDALTAQVAQLTGEQTRLQGILDKYGISYEEHVVPESNISYDYVDLTGLEGSELEEAKVYNKVFGNYAHIYENSYEAKSLSEKYALQAIAEAKLLETGAILPGEGNGGNYAISRVAYKSVPGVLWGTDADRLGSAIVTTEFIKAADRDALKALWVANKGTGTYLAKVKEYLTGHGYTLSRDYKMGYTGDPDSWDVLSDYYATTAEALVMTYDGLVEYDCEDKVQPALSTTLPVWGTDANGKMTCSFTIREGVKWTKQDGTYICDVTADDFVAGFQHMLDAGTHGWYVAGVIEGVDEYDGTNFNVVGIKAEGNKLTYTFTEEAKARGYDQFFETMLGYSPLAPLCRQYYVSEGGKFGAEYSTAENPMGTYAQDYTHIAYCGPYRISQYTAENTIAYVKNADYYNLDKINVDTITMLFNDGSDPTKAYTDAKAGTIAGCGLGSATLPLAKQDGLFDTYAYVSGVDAGTYPFWFNGNRQTFTSFSETYPLDSRKTAEEKTRGLKALANVYFRLALCCSIDRVAYEIALTGDKDIAANCLLNSYTPATFVHLTEEVTVDINGTPRTFPAGAGYGEIMQAQIEADGYPFVVWHADASAEDGRGTGSGYDGWYNTGWAQAFLGKAIEELKAEGVEVTRENPIVLELPYIQTNASNTAGNVVVKNSIEQATGGLVKVNLLSCASAYNLYYAAYYNPDGKTTNVDISKISGWGPDYGDPKTYLDTFLPLPDGMVKNFGIY